MQRRAAITIPGVEAESFIWQALHHIVLFEQALCCQNLCLLFDQAVGEIFNAGVTYRKKIGIAGPDLQQSLQLTCIRSLRCIVKRTAQRSLGVARTKDP